MTLEEKAASLELKDVVALLVRVDELERRITWLQDRVFGRTSEKRIVEPDPRQASLGDEFRPEDSAGQEETVTVAGHTRARKHDDAAGEEDCGFRFDDSVPVEEILLENPDAKLEGAKVIGEKVTYKLAQQPVSYVWRK